MSDLRPWLEEGAPEAITQLLKAARNEEPSPESLPRILSAVGAGIATASTTAAAGAMLGKAATSGAVGAKASFVSGVSIVKWMLVGAALGGAVVVVTEHERSLERAPPRSIAPTSSSATTSSLRAAPAPPAMPPPQVVEPPAPKPATSMAARATSERDSRSEVPPPAPASSDSERLVEEVRAIDRAKTALTSGRPEQTLSALDRYDELHREPRFVPEALYLRMEALVQLHRQAEAKRVAQRLVAAYPTSPQAARARFFLSQTIP